MYIKHIQTISNNYLISRTFPCLSNPCDRPQRSHSQTCRFSQWVQVHLKVLVLTVLRFVVSQVMIRSMAWEGWATQSRCKQNDWQTSRSSDLSCWRKCHHAASCLGCPESENIGNASAFNAIQKIGNMRWKLIKWALAAWARNIQPLLGALSKHCFPIKRRTHWPLMDSKPD